MAIFCFVTVYLLGQALGGLVFPPIAECFGGRIIYMLSTTAVLIHLWISTAVVGLALGPAIATYI